MKSVLLILWGFLALDNLQNATALTENPKIQDQYFDSGGVRIRYFVVGKGEPVVLIHGWAANADMWQNVISDLSRDYQLIAFDCRGHVEARNHMNLPNTVRRWSTTSSA